MKELGYIICLSAGLLAGLAFSQPFTFNDRAFVGQSFVPEQYSATMNYLALTNTTPGTLLTVPVLINGTVPTNTLYGLTFSANAINQFTVSTIGPAFPTPIQIGNSVYLGTEAQSIEMTNDQPYSTIEFSMPAENLPYLSVAGFVKIPALANTPATYDLIVIGTVQTNLPYDAEDWTLQLSCGQTNYLDLEDANGISGTEKLNWVRFPADQWLYFAMSVNTTNFTETALVCNASNWAVVTAVTNTMSVTNAFQNYWLFGNNEAGSQAGLNFSFSGLIWTNTPPAPPAPPYTSSTNQLIAQYKFNGDFTDASANGFDGAEWGVSCSWVSGQDGMTNQAVSLNSVTVSSVATNPVYAMTTSYWVNTATAGGMPVAHSEFTSWYNFITSGGQVQLSLYTTGGNIVMQTTGVVTDGNWHLVVCTWDGVYGDHAARIYLDGVLDTTSSVLTGTITPSTSELTVGSGISGYYFTGTLEDVRLYGRALSAAEVSASYAAGADGDINL
ncbi:MAG: LamG domain-containing protein [Verrucomicrobiota bacterium]|jgi:hypothetical protein